MNTLVVFDSQYGNTEKIARRIAQSLDPYGSARAVRVNELGPDTLAGVEMLVVGSPTQSWNSTTAMKNFIAQLEPVSVKKLLAAAFDTRVDKPRLITGSAAYAIAKQLKRRGWNLVVKPECFLVTGMEGPLAEGELERAAAWALTLYDEFKMQMDPVLVPM